MNSITQWVKNLVFIILFTSLLEMFLPENNMRKYVRVVMGFFVISIFISPLAVLFKQDFSATYKIIPDKVVVNNWEEIKKRGDKIDQSNQKLIKEYYEERVKQRVKEVVDLDYPNLKKEIEVNVNEDYQLQKIDIILYKNSQVELVEIEPVVINGSEEKEVIPEEKESLDQYDLQRRISQIFQVPLKNVVIQVLERVN